MRAPCHDCKRWEGRCTAAHSTWGKCLDSGFYSKFLPKGDRFTHGDRDTWNGILEQIGRCNFSVVGTYGVNCHPVILINSSEEPINCDKAAIDWKTGKFVKFFGEPSQPVDSIE